MSTSATLIRLAGTSALLLIAGVVQAHPGHLGGHDATGMFTLGFWHPLTGSDHLLAMLAVGLWSALTHKSLREAIWLPITFAALLLVGAGLGLAGVRLPAIEPMIMASLLVMGLLVASRANIPAWAGFTLVGLFAVFHGLAHGMELPADDGAASFVMGFMVTTLLLHMAGLLAGFQLRHRSHWISGMMGAGIAAYGALLFTGI